MPSGNCLRYPLLALAKRNSGNFLALLPMLLAGNGQRPCAAHSFLTTSSDRAMIAAFGSISKHVPAVLYRQHDVPPSSEVSLRAVSIALLFLPL